MSEASTETVAKKETQRHRASEYKNCAFRGAYSKGWGAGWDGTPVADCPYEDRRTEGGQVTFSRGLIKAWKAGHKDGLLSRGGSDEELSPSEAAEKVKATQPKKRRRSIITK